jgi:hypothetical protein
MSVIRGAVRLREPILTLICATVISSCGDDGASTQPTTAVSEATVPAASADPSASGGVDGPVVFTGAPNPSEPGVEAAGLIGTLELVGQCLLVGAGVGRRSVVVWPFGTTWSDDESAVILPDHSAVPIGSKIFTGGGDHEADRLDDEQWLSDPEALERVRGCVDNEGRESVFVNQDTVEVIS